MTMMPSTEGRLDIKRNVPGERRVEEARCADEGNGSQGLPAKARSLMASVQSVKEELAAVRCEQAKLQQAIYEAAQVQRRLCAPRELVWGEFEIAGEIFPVRHLSG